MKCRGEMEIMLPNVDALRLDLPGMMVGDGGAGTARATSDVHRPRKLCPTQTPGKTPPT
nr:hypothetical protein [uncultured organism]